MKKDRSLCILLCSIGICGVGGLHDFYLGCYWLGIIKLFTINFFGIGTLIDLILLITNSYYITPKQPQVQQYRPQTTSQPTYAPASIDRVSEEGITWQTGTDSQIDWAEDVVRKFMEQVNELIDEAIEKDKLGSDEGAELLSSIEYAITSKDDANWWIDNRSLGTKKLAKELFDFDDEEQILIMKL